MQSRLLAIFCITAGLAAGCDLQGPDDSELASASVTLAWDAPMTNADGTPLTDLAGYRIRYGQSSPLTSENSTFIDVGNVTSHAIAGLQPGTYFFAVSAVDVNGNVSSLSEEVGSEIPRR
jgi:hypothetical protein